MRESTTLYYDTLNWNNTEIRTMLITYSKDSPVSHTPFNLKLLEEVSLNIDGDLSGNATSPWFVTDQTMMHEDLWHLREYRRFLSSLARHNHMHSQIKSRCLVQILSRPRDQKPFI